MFKRLICDLILLAGLIFLSWYWTALLIILFMILFRNYWEGIVAAFFIDFLYSTATHKIYSHFGLFSVLTLVLFFVIKKFKSMIRI